MRPLLFALLLGCTSSDPTGAPASPCVVTTAPSSGVCTSTDVAAICCTRAGFAINAAERCVDFSKQIVLDCNVQPAGAACTHTGPSNCVATASGHAFFTQSTWSAPGFFACTEEQRAAVSRPCAR